MTSSSSSAARSLGFSALSLGLLCSAGACDAEPEGTDAGGDVSIADAALDSGALDSGALDSGDSADAFVPAPRIFEAGSGGVDHYALWIVGEGFSADSIVEVFHPADETRVIGAVPASASVLGTSADGAQLLTARVPGFGARTVFERNGLSVRVRTGERASEAIPVTRAPHPDPFERGGAAYYLASLGELSGEFEKSVEHRDPRYFDVMTGRLNDAGRDIWHDPERGAQPLVGAFHDQPPELVPSQLDAMIANGQRSFSVNIWFAPLNDVAPDTPQLVDDRWGHIIDSSLGRLTAQHEANLRAILALVRERPIHNLHIRFAHQSYSDPFWWGKGESASVCPDGELAWCEELYQRNRELIFNTRDLVVAEMESSATEIYFDLATEFGGKWAPIEADPDPDRRALAALFRAYVRRLWSDYFSRYGRSHTYGFSYNIHNAGVVPAMIALYDEVFEALDEDGDGVVTINGTDFRDARPGIQAFDTYTDMPNGLATVSRDLADHGMAGTPVIIQETCHNDRVARGYFEDARAAGLNIRLVFSFPTRCEWEIGVRDDVLNTFNYAYSADYGSYFIQWPTP